MRPPEPRGRGQWIGLALGVPVMAVGVRGILSEPGRTHPTELARWVVGSALVHDMVVLPIVLLVGVLVRRLVPDWTWPTIRWGLLTTGCILVVAWPFVRGYGRRADNPSLLPRDYGGGTLVALGLLWVACGGWLLWRRRGRTGQAAPERAPSDAPA